MACSTASRAKLLQGFDELPDGALVGIRAISALQDIGESAAWERAKSDPHHPTAIRLSSKCTRWRVGDVRRYIAIKAGEVLPEAAQ